MTEQEAVAIVGNLFLRYPAIQPDSQRIALWSSELVSIFKKIPAGDVRAACEEFCRQEASRYAPSLDSLIAGVRQILARKNTVVTQASAIPDRSDAEIELALKEINMIRTMLAQKFSMDKN